MESTRQQKFAKLVQRELSDIFQREARSLFGQVFITITQVRVTPDLGIAKIYLSLLLDKQKEETLEMIQEQTKTLRQMMAQRIKNQVRVIPELHFYLDDTADYAAHIEDLLSGLDIPPADEEEPTN
ncbi:MAG TPA: 30S ribosome-binding factor RbfA [Microscillaceae bacterium]|jgi:ribosome-binding factor A|nr:30S ribosome-binding factor RbfA [Microscillaceae bacterium]